METIAILGFMMYVCLPCDIWNGLSAENQLAVIGKISEYYFENHQCRKARVMVIETENEVQFFFKCEELII